jgi:hypothetical protein
MLFGVLLICMMAGVLSAANTGTTAGSTNGAALQVSGYTTVPQTVYPGSTGELQITITNSGTDTASSTVVDYELPGQTQPAQITVGDIGAGSSAIASIPFQVPMNVSSGFFVMSLNVVYFGDPTDTTVKNTPLSITVMVSQHQILNVKTISVTPASVQAGDEVTVDLDVQNTGGVMNDAVITADGDTNFTLAGATQQTVGNVPSGGDVNVSVLLVASSSAQPGRYNIPLILTYEDLLQNTVNQTISVGPVTVSEASAEFMVSMVPTGQVEVGGEAPFSLTLTNLADNVISATVDLTENTPFTPIGSSRVFFNGIEPGQSQTQTVMVGISAGTTSGYYDFPLVITSNGNSYNQTMGILVNATSDVDISATTTPEFISSGSTGVKLTAEIANTGNGPMRSVYADGTSTKDFVVIGTTDKFIGTLNIDDFGTLPLIVNVPANLTPGDYSLPISVTFKDANNVEQTIVKNLTITIYSAQDAARDNLLANGGTGTTGTTGTYGGRGGGGLFGISYIMWIGIIVVIVLAYFGYKKYKGNKK